MTSATASNVTKGFPMRSRLVREVARGAEALQRAAECSAVRSHFLRG
jgi:hypothetical protein